MKNNLIPKIIATVNLFSSGLITFSYSLLLFFQKDCSYCSLFIWPLLYFSILFLAAYLSLKTIEDSFKFKKTLTAINVIGILSSTWYFLQTYLI